MRAASINLNKRLGNSAAAKRFFLWLDLNKIDLVLIQEPWARNKDLNICPLGFADLGGNDSVRTWLRAGIKSIQTSLLSDRLQIAQVDFVVFINAYLSAYSSEDRGASLSQIQQYAAKHLESPICISGDFNLAPQPRDGLVGGDVSDFTKEHERRQLAKLLREERLIDCTAPKGSELPQYTIEREIKGRAVQFRCDLLLMSDYLACVARGIGYDHTVRQGPEAFTDHSAIIFELPLEPERRDHTNLELFDHFAVNDVEVSAPVSIAAHKTAMATDRPSIVARYLQEHSLPSSCRVLDYGCGRGRDIKFLKDAGFDTTGYDPFPDFGFVNKPIGCFDIVMCNYVLNVLPNIASRLQVVRQAAHYVKPNGLLIISARSRSEIEMEARTKNWLRFGDGYWSSQSKATFQKGIEQEEMEILVSHTEAKFRPEPLTFDSGPSSTIGAFRRL